MIAKKNLVILASSLACFSCFFRHRQHCDRTSVVPRSDSASQWLQDRSRPCNCRAIFPENEVTKRRRLKISGNIHDGKSNLLFPALPAGEYVVVFHSINDNGIDEHNFIGLPTGAMGFSNGFRVSLTSGMPSYLKLDLRHDGEAQTIQLNESPRVSWTLASRSKYCFS